MIPSPVSLASRVRTTSPAWTIGLSSIAVFLIALEITIISVALPEIGAEFADSSRATLSWVFTAYNVGVASLMLIAGWLAERYGRKRVFLIGMVIFGLGSIVSGVAGGAAVLITGRAIQSIGGAAIIPASLALILHTVADDRRDQAIGIWGAMAGLAAAVGPTLGALLIDAAGWRWVFLVNVPIVAAALAAGTVRLVETHNAEAPRRVDVLAPPLGAAAVGMAVFAIAAAGERGLTDPLIIGVSLIGIGLLALFVGRTVSHHRPLFPLALAALPSYRVGALGTLFFGAGFAGWLVLAPTFLVEHWDYSVLRSGFAIAPAPVAMAITAGPAGKLCARFGHRIVIAIGSLIAAAASLFWIASIGSEPAWVTAFLPGAVLLGIGVGVGFPMLTAASTRDVPAHQYAVGAAGNTTIRQVAIALGISIAIAIVGGGSGAAADLGAYQLSWAVCGVCFVATSAVIAALYPSTAIASAERARLVPVATTAKAST